MSLRRPAPIASRYSDLPSACTRSSQHQVGDVATCNGQQHDREDAQHANHERLVRVAVEAALQLSEHGSRHRSVGLRIRRCETREDRRRLRAGSLPRHACSQTSFDRERSSASVRQLSVVSGPVQCRRHHEWHEERRAGQIEQPVERVRDHSDHLEVEAVESHELADHRRIGGEVTLPEILTKDDDRIASRHLVFLWPEPATETRHNLERLEDICRGGKPYLELRLSPGITGEAGSQDSNRGQAGKRSIAVSDVEVLQIREAPVIGRGTGRERHHAKGIGHLERPQEERIGQAENRGIRANRQSDRDDGGKGKPRASAKGSQGVPKIVQHGSLRGR